MSALLAPVESPTQARDRLRPLPQARRRLARLPFLIVLAMLVAVGMAGVLVLSVTLQQRADRLSSLRSQDAELGYQEASLQARVEQLSSVTSLSHHAYQLGMRPNPAPVFINLGSGGIVGKPTRVTGREMLDQSGSSIYQQDAGIAAARTKVMAPQPATTPSPQGLPSAAASSGPSPSTGTSSPAAPPAQVQAARPAHKTTATASGGH